METKQTKIAANMTWFTTALVVQKFISLAYFTYLARQLGASNLGMYTFALSYIAIFSIIVDFGLANLITREVAKNKSISQNLYSSVLGFKIFSSLLAVVMAIIALQLLSYSILVRQLVYLALLLMVIESLVLTSYAIWRGNHNLRYESLGTISVQLIIALLGVAVLNFTKDVRWLMLVMVVANFIHLIYVTVLLLKKLRLKLKVFFNFTYLKTILKLALPFAVAAGFTRIYGSFDQVLLSRLASSEALGYYAVAYKLTFALQFIPLALVASLYPAMSTYYLRDKTLLNKAFTRSVYYLLIFTVPLSAGISFLARPFIESLYTQDYLPAVRPLQILILSLTFLFINFPLGALLNASNRQTRNTVNIGLAMIFNIALNIILIPRWQAVGAAVSSLSSTIFLFIISWQSVYRIVNIDYKYLRLTAVKTVFATVVMISFLDYAFGTLPWVLAAIIGSAVYLLCQLIFRGIRRRDVSQLYHSFASKK